MSRALNLTLSIDEVRDAITKLKAVVTSIEPLFPQGTRVVLKTADDAANLRRALKNQLIEGPVVRKALRIART